MLDLTPAPGPEISKMTEEMDLDVKLAKLAKHGLLLNAVHCANPFLEF